MTHRLFAIASLAVLAACSGDTAADAQTGRMAGGAEVITAESLTETRASIIKDQKIECVQTLPSGNIARQYFIIRDQTVLSYSQMQNAARAMCDPGQPDCALGWAGDDIGLYFRTASGALNQIRVNLGSMVMKRRLTTASKGVEESTSTCTASPIPDDIRYL